MNIPFIDFTRDKGELKQIKNAVNKVINSGNYILGKQVSAFENKFKKFTGHKYAIGVNSGTDALIIILKALKIKTIALCAAAPLPCIQAILCEGIEPILIDAKDMTGRMDINELKKEIKNVDAVLLVHLYGIPESIETIKFIKRKKKIIIEDCSQSIDTYINKKHTGNFSIAAAFSFYPTKNLGCLGDGGMIVTNNKKLAQIFLMMRNYGIRKTYSGEIKGVNSRLDEIQATVLLNKIKLLKSKNKKRKRIAYYYNKNIKNRYILTLPMDILKISNCHIYPIFTDYRDELKNYLSKNGVQTKIHYPIPLHKQNILKMDKKFIITEKISLMELSLPIFPELKKHEIERIIMLINKF